MKSHWLWFLGFIISMAYVESAVVVYLRELYYPGGFSFPLVTMSLRVAVTEIFRELATLIMLLAVGYLAGSNFRQRFAWFIIGFGVWDIFYYIFLKLLINWPDSWFTWDILFLIPILWTGPVIVPILVSVTMILLSLAFLYADRRKGSNQFRRIIWLFIITGSVLIFLSCTWDFGSFLASRKSLRSVLTPGIHSGLITMYIPGAFNWILFMAGEAAELTAIFLLCISSRKEKTATHIPGY